MFTISLVSQKGGTGKSTILVGLAVAAARAGYDVAVIDVDPQATAANWKDRRSAENPAVVSAQASRLRQTLDAARDGGVQYAFVDTAGRLDDSALNAVRLSDLVLTPTRPNIAEVETLPKVRDMITLAGSPPTFLLLNGVHPAATTAVREVHTALRSMYGFECCPVHICQRAAYADCLVSGSAPQEIDADGKAADELTRLFQFVCEFVNTSEETNGLKVRRHSSTA
ncbi:MAG: AAA family ATPase [Beijerinckiaceae bacterium]